MTPLLLVSAATSEAQEAPDTQQAIPLPSVTVEASQKKAEKPKAAKKAPSQASSASAAPKPLPAPASTVRDKSADTEGTNSYTTGAVTVGSKVPLSLREQPQSISVVTRQQIEDQNANTLQDALKYTPGVTVAPFNPSIPQYHARGYFLNVAHDGVPAYDGINGQQQFDLAIYDRVEVLRGPAGLFQGTGNPSGVVNLVKKRPRDEAGAAWAVSYGSWNNKWAELDLTTPLNASKTLRARGVLAGRDTDFYFDRANEDKWLGYGVIEYDITRNTLLTVSAARQQYDGPSWHGLPAATDGSFLDVPRSTNVYPDWNSMTWDTREYTASLEHKFANDWKLKASLSRREQRFTYNDAYPRTAVDPVTLTAPYSWREAHPTWDRDAADIYLNAPIYAFGLKHNFLVGYSYEQVKTTNTRSNVIAGGNVPILNPNPFLPHPVLPLLVGGDTVSEQSGFYGQARIKLFEPLTLIGGGRITNFNNIWNTKSRVSETAPWTVSPWTQGGDADNEITAYGAAILDLTDALSVYGSYSDIFIPQTARVFPSGTLPPRIGAQKEIGIKGEFFDKALNASLAYFDIRETNRSFADPNNPTYFLPLGEVQSSGIEVEVAGRVFPGLEVTAGYTYLKTEFLSDRNNQGFAISGLYPEHSFKLWANYDFQDPAFDRWSVGVGLLAQSETMDAAKQPNRSQSPYAVVNTLIGYDFADNLHASLAINNVFDETYYARVGAANGYNVYGEPRNYMLTLRKSFD